MNKDIEICVDKKEVNIELDIKTVAPSTQSKTIIPTKETQIVEPDDGVFALSRITVESIPDEYIIPKGTINITSNGTVNVSNYAEANVEIEDIVYKILTNQLYSWLCPYEVNLKANFLYSVNNLKYASFKHITEYGNYNVYGNTNIKTMLFGEKCNTPIANLTLNGSHNITNLILNRRSVHTLASTFGNCNSVVRDKTCRFWVPDTDANGNDLPSQYKSTTNWDNYPDLIKGYSEASEYNEAKTYSIDDYCVKYNGKFYGYYNTVSTTGIAPSGTNENNDYWEYIGDLG